MSEDARGLSLKLGPGDRQRLDQYLSAVGELETIQYSDSWGVNYSDYALGFGQGLRRHLERSFHLA